MLLRFERETIYKTISAFSVLGETTQKSHQCFHTNHKKRERERERERDMGLLELATGFNIAVLLVFFLLLVTLRVLFSCWISPTLKYWKIRRNGFGGPTPSFPFGNIKAIVKMSGDSSLQSSNSPHDIHSNVFPYFAQWQKSHGELLAS